jgi:hypothetical protein
MATFGYRRVFSDWICVEVCRDEAVWWSATWRNLTHSSVDHPADVRIYHQQQTNSDQRYLSVWYVVSSCWGHQLMSMTQLLPLGIRFRPWVKSPFSSDAASETCHWAGPRVKGWTVGGESWWSHTANSLPLKLLVLGMSSGRCPREYLEIQLWTVWTIWALLKKPFGVFLKLIDGVISQKWGCLKL